MKQTNYIQTLKKARKLLKWKPKIKLNSGLKKTINYYVQKNMEKKVSVIVNFHNGEKYLKNCIKKYFRPRL